MTEELSKILIELIQQGGSTAIWLVLIIYLSKITMTLGGLAIAFGIALKIVKYIMGSLQEDRAHKVRLYEVRYGKSS